jgi:hypothetical protein
MNICEEHRHILRRGMTYCLTKDNDCEICRLLDFYENIDYYNNKRLRTAQEIDNQIIDILLQR